MLYNITFDKITFTFQPMVSIEIRCMERLWFTDVMVKHFK